MKRLRILCIGWGAVRNAAVSFKRMLASAEVEHWEFGELNLRCPPRGDETVLLADTLAQSRFDVLVLVLAAEVSVPRAAGFFDVARCSRCGKPIVVVCQTASPEERSDLIRLGASEVLTGPFPQEDNLRRFLVLCQRTDEEHSAAKSLRAKLGLGQIIGQAGAFVAALQQIPLIARHDAPAFIQGETGTGKEIFARAVHYQSARSAKPFVPVNCGAIPVDLLENEFFGHEPGAFTSASASRRGVLQEADGGTLFLDEVDCLPALAQVKMLRFLQDGQFRPLGGERVCHADVRVIAASNSDLAAALAAGRFRHDLFYRLNVLPLHLPPLRQREGDVVLLAQHFLAKYAGKYGVEVKEFSAEALQKLVCHDWPGNVRELENTVHRVVALSEQTVVPAKHVCFGNGAPVPERQSFRQMKAKAVSDFERSYIRQILLAHDGNITKAAQSAGKNRRAFWELMRKHQISPTPALSGS